MSGNTRLPHWLKGLNKCAKEVYVCSRVAFAASLTCQLGNPLSTSSLPPCQTLWPDGWACMFQHAGINSFLEQITVAFEGQGMPSLMFESQCQSLWTQDLEFADLENPQSDAATSSGLWIPPFERTYLPAVLEVFKIIYLLRVSLTAGHFSIFINKVFTILRNLGGPSTRHLDSICWGHFKIMGSAGVGTLVKILFGMPKSHTAMPCLCFFFSYFLSSSFPNYLFIDTEKERENQRKRYFFLFADLFKNIPNSWGWPRLKPHGQISLQLCGQQGSKHLSHPRTHRTRKLQSGCNWSTPLCSCGLSKQPLTCCI